MSYRYKLFARENYDRLSDDITQALADDWELWGNPFSAGDGEFPLYCQAVVKRNLSGDEITKAVDELEENAAKLQESAGILSKEEAAGFAVGNPS